VQHGCRVSNGLKSVESYSSGAASKGGSPSQQLAPTNTDEQGLCSVCAIPQGANYTLDVAAPGCGTNSLTVPAVGTQTNQMQMTPIVLKFANRQVAGQVIGQDGNPCWAPKPVSAGRASLQPNPAAPKPADSLSSKTSAAGRWKSGRCFLGMNQGRLVVGVVGTSGGDTNVVVKLGVQNGVAALFRLDQGLPPANHLLPPSLLGNREYRANQMPYGDFT
jgi:hypothetical protein